MSSALRTMVVKKEGLTRFIKPESPAYDIGEGDYILFPFSYSNGVLDISFEGNDFESIMVDNLNVGPGGETQTAVSILSGPYLATSLGDNFKAYIRAWRDGTIDAGSPINVYIAPQLLKVQEADYANIDANSGDPYKISTTPPVSDYYTAGDATNKYQTKYVFKTPLTFTIIEDGVKKYITFRTKFDQE
jgi:hypothetical protein